MSGVVVVGSLNMDLVAASSRFPKIGETILGEQLQQFIGGKGANQAVAAARMDVATSLLGNIGGDVFGAEILAKLTEEQLNLTHIGVEKEQVTGTAVIIKANGDNSIVVVPGANLCSDADFIRKHQAVIAQADVLLGQLEIPVAGLKEAFKIAKENQVLTILNPAPYTNQLIELLPYTDYLTPNETEFAELSAYYGGSGPLEEELLRLNEQLAAAIIVTRGENGVAFVEGDQVQTIPAISVEVKDTTGAGDTFNGILAACLSQKRPLQQAIEIAGRGASVSVTKEGAQGGMPTKNELMAQEKI